MEVELVCIRTRIGLLFGVLLGKEGLIELWGSKSFVGRRKDEINAWPELTMTIDQCLRIPNC